MCASCASCLPIPPDFPHGNVIAGLHVETMGLMLFTAGYCSYNVLSSCRLNAIGGWFVSECMKLRETMPALARHLEGYHVDMFSSDGDA
jgi:hypothetical protein